jgi:predicted transcriptional regulator
MSRRNAPESSTWKHAVEIVAAYLSKNRVAAGEIPDTLRGVHTALSELASPDAVKS